MMLRKQTVWLLTMLAVMVVLSGYYMVKGPNEQMPAVSEESKTLEPLMGIEVDSKQTDQPTPEATPVEGQNTGAKDATTTEEAAAVNAPTPSADYFQGYKLKREAMTQQQKDEQMQIMTSGEATPQAVAEAKAKHEELSQVETKTLALEELIKANGYKDCVVYMQDSKVDVVVQKDKLTSKEVVDIIALTKQHMGVSGKDVTVRFKP
ncbi:SpoIIIAH-like family protein [Brevibacillus dissolubilis]|uniref:SpoIIIAH-like family protein n=1 Tax=Brevibacillus dissolubilis TaxID=1844116 RepID=UPI001116CEB6|nr:SpoIIIAH-like family protein [Brevibacillus dissolubilis]